MVVMFSVRQERERVIGRVIHLVNRLQMIAAIHFKRNLLTDQSGVCLIQACRDLLRNGLDVLLHHFLLLSLVLFVLFDHLLIELHLEVSANRLL